MLKLPRFKVAAAQASPVFFGSGRNLAPLGWAAAERSEQGDMEQRLEPWSSQLAASE